MDWVLLHLAGAAGSRFWDKDGIRKVSTVPGFDDARITGLSSQRYIVVSGEISRHLQNASLDLPTAASLRDQGSSATPPLELIFTGAGKDCDSLVVLSISGDKRLTMLAFDASPGTTDAHATIKKNVKAAFGLSSTLKFMKSTVTASQRSMPTGDMSLNAARTASILFGGKHAATPRDAPRFMKVWIVTQILDSIKGTILSQSPTSRSGGSSGADPSDSKGGGSGGGGGGGETGGNGTNSNQGGPEPGAAGGSGAPMPSVQRACGGAGDAPGALCRVPSVTRWPRSAMYHLVSRVYVELICP